MPLVDYPATLGYLPASGGGALCPAIEVELIYGEQATKAVGVVDSGSTVTVFNPEHAELLGIDDVTDGELQNIGTQGGPVHCYIFDLEMQVEMEDHTRRFTCRVGFFPTRRPRNILGTNVLFQHYQIGFNDRMQQMYFLPEN